jgi:DNA-binding transcriptional ArsR family regulator
LEATIRTLATLAPHDVYFPDFLTPTLTEADLPTAVDAVLSTPRPRLLREMTTLADKRRLPNWARQVAHGDPTTLRGLGAAMLAYHGAVVTPYQQEMTVHLDAEYARRAGIQLRGGTDALLSSFAPLMRWESPVLHVSYPIAKDLWLGGRGMVLVPSFFCWHRPVTLADPELSPALVYPIEHRPDWLTEPRRGGGLSGLVGATRAAILAATVPGRSTGRLAELVGVSAATVSHHISVLRDANLVTTRREASWVVHTATPLGVALLDSAFRAPSKGVGAVERD